jgi:hypothetical protein
MSRTMNLLRRLRKVTLAGLFAAACWAGSSNMAMATDYPPAGYRYEYVIRYETQRVAYTAYETRYDHCGNPYQAEVTRYRTVQVPVRVRVLVPCH